MGEAVGEVLYRGWEREITITVGCEEDRRQFRGRRDLLAEQSGYFKSLVGEEEVAVPGVSPEVFARILQFVNTGLLDLTPENIYSVLLATHLLHMPKALELCRSYLVLERHRLLNSPPPPSIVKPIPSRKYFFWPPPPPPFFPLPPPPPPHYARSLFVHPSPAVPLSLDFEPLPSTSVLQSTIGVVREAAPTASPPHEPTANGDDEKADKGVYRDIACCDGPVRFKRVLNINYGAVLTPDEREAASTKQDDSHRRRLFVCTFCNHTFKSHYCFRKHTRRHLNPVPLDASAAATIAARSPQEDAKDMNVQYYPCKTCGSKFPSYYFVHKHRKMVHGPEHYSDNKPSPPATTDE